MIIQIRAAHETNHRHMNDHTNTKDLQTTKDHYNIKDHEICDGRVTVRYGRVTVR